jgi:hypothetical protein
MSERGADHQAGDVTGGESEFMRAPLRQDGGMSEVMPDSERSGADGTGPRGSSTVRPFGNVSPLVIERERAITAHERRMAQVVGQLNVSQADLALLVVEAVRNGWWQQSGIHSVAHWIGWQTGVSPTVAARLVTLAEKWDAFPVTTARFVAGELSLDQTYEILRRAPASADRGMAQLGAELTVGQLRALLARYVFDEDPAETTEALDDDGAGGHQQVDPYGQVPTSDGDDGRSVVVPELRPESEIHDPLASDPPASSQIDAIDLSDGADGQVDPHADGRPCHDPRAEYVTLIQLEDGTWRLSGRLDADHGLVLDAARRELHDHLFQRDGRAPSSAEVLVAMAERSLAQVDLPARRDRYRVHVTLDERRELVDPYGHTLPAWIRDLITCDAEASVLWTRHGRPIATGGPTDPIPAAVRRYVLARDGGCRIPWCQSRHGLEVHHVVHREHGGTNAVGNLVAVCRRHHRQHHRGEFTISGDADQPGALRITAPDGREVRRPRPIVPDRPPDPPAAPYRHPPGERIVARWLDIPQDRPAPRRRSEHDDAPPGCDSAA